MDDISYSENKDQVLRISADEGSSWIQVNEIGNLGSSVPEVTYLPDGYTLTEVRAPSYLNMTTSVVSTKVTNPKDAYAALTSHPSILKQISYQYDDIGQFRNIVDAVLYRMNTSGISQKESGILIDALVYLIFYNSYVCLNFQYSIVNNDPLGTERADIVLRANLYDDERLISKEVYISIKEFIEETFAGLVKLDTSTVVEDTIDALVEEVLWKLTYEDERPLSQEDLDRYAALWGIC